MQLFEVFRSRMFLTERTRIDLYPHGQGAQIHNSGVLARINQIPIHHVTGNEVFKNRGYFRRNKLRQDHLLRHVLAGGKLPPLTGIIHPADRAETLILDGNHRLSAYRQARRQTVPVAYVPHGDVHLMNHGFDHPGNYRSYSLDMFGEPDGSYDMTRPRAELGGRALRHYFANAGGTSAFNRIR